MLAALVLVCSVILDVWLLPHHIALGLDFLTFYAAGLAVRRGYDPYNATQFSSLETGLHFISHPHQHMVFFGPYVNPPLFAWAMSALTALPVQQAYVIWLSLLVATTLASMAMLANLCGMCGRAWVLLVFIVSPLPVDAFFLGQQAPLLLFGLTAALTALRRKHPELAGMVLAIGWIKPQLLLPLVPVLALLAGYPRSMPGWAGRLLAGFVGSSVLCGLVSWLAVGGRLFGDWVHSLVAFGHAIATTQPAIASLAGLYLDAVGQHWSGYLSAALMGAWLLYCVLLVRNAHRTGLVPTDDGWLRVVGLALTAWLLATPYAHPADLVLLAVALPTLLGRRLEGLGSAWVRLLCGIALTAPELDLLGGFQLSPAMCYSVLVPLVMLLALRPWQGLPVPGLRPTVS